MPIILPVETRSRRVKVLHAAMYVLLTVGAASMVYPMLLMVAGSVKSEVDTADVNFRPAFLFRDDALYQKFLESKYGGQLLFLQQAYLSPVRSWRQLTIPPEPDDARRLDRFDQFRRQTTRADWQVIAHGWGPSGLVFRNTRAFREHLRKQFGGSIEALNNAFGTTYHSFLQIVPPVEIDVPSRRFSRPDNPFQECFDRFKMALPPTDRVFIDLDGYYQQNYLQPMYHTIDQFNRTHQTRFASFTDVLLDEHPPDHAGLRKDWEYFVRNELNLSFIRVDGKPVPGNLPDPNLDLQKQVPLQSLSIFGPRQAFEKFLNENRGGLTAPAVVFSGSSLSRAVRAADYREFQTVKNAFRWDCLKRNYLAVLDHVLLHGRGVINTVIYCVLAVMSQLLVNPLAAYALSRYKPPGAYKILLFCMATMAFPSAVTMIPSFLLLRNLGLLNTFAALILPGLANGYWIFLLKGFFDSLPKELYEAADLDGASEWRKFWTITMSLSKPILAVIALGAFTAAYSNFMFALIIVPDQRMWTLMVWIYQLQLSSPQGIVYASLTLAAIPTLLVFLLAQNVILRGIVVPVEK